MERPLSCAGIADHYNWSDSCDEFVGLLTAMADDFMGFTNVIDLFGKLLQTEFATCYFLVGGHTVAPDNTVGVLFLLSGIETV